MRQDQWVCTQRPLPGLSLEQREYLQKDPGDLYFSRWRICDEQATEADKLGNVFHRWHICSERLNNLLTRGDTAFITKVLARIAHYRLMDICVITRSSEKTAITLCNLWSLTKYHSGTRIFLHEFSLRSGQWSEQDPGAIRWADIAFADNWNEARDTERDIGEWGTDFAIPVLAHPSTKFSIVNSMAYPEHFLPPIWPSINVFSLKKDNICSLLPLLLLRKLICEDGTEFGADRLVIQDRIADLREIWKFCSSAVQFNSGFKWGGVRRALWDGGFLDKKLMSVLCAKNYGRSISLESYLAALPYASALGRIAEESRSLLPLLNCIPPQHWGRRDLFKNESLRELNAVFATLDDTHLRFLRKLPCSILNKLYRHNSLRDVLDLLLGIQIQEKIPAAILRRVIRHSWRPFAVPGMHGRMLELQRFYRLYIRHCLALWKQEGHIKLGRYLRNNHELARIMDWFFAEGIARGQPDKNATWNSLRRASNAWHTQFEEADAEARIQDIQENKNTTTLQPWQSLLEEMEIGSVSIRPLTSASALEKEGKAMGHCVASYAAKCLQHNFRIFSLSDESRGARTTLCIAPDRSGRWRVYEHRGGRNCGITHGAHEIAKKVCRLYEEAERR